MQMQNVSLDKDIVLVKDDKQYILNKEDLKQYYSGELHLKNVRFWDKDEYKKKPSLFTDLDDFAQDKSFAGLVTHVTQVQTSDFESGHRWVQVVANNQKSSVSQSSIVGDISQLFTNDKQGAQAFANNIIKLFNKSREQIGIKYGDHNSLRLSRYLFTLSRIAHIVPNVWMNFIIKNQE